MHVYSQITIDRAVCLQLPFAEDRFPKVYKLRITGKRSYRILEYTEAPSSKHGVESFDFLLQRFHATAFCSTASRESSHPEIR